MILAGVDLAWISAKNPSAISYGKLENRVLTVSEMDVGVIGIDNVISSLQSILRLRGIAIDAPLIIRNEVGQRNCETAVSRIYGSKHAGCHTSNLKLYPNSASVKLSETLDSSGFKHLSNEKWQIECYPHPTILEVFDLEERLKYKKGRVAEKKAGQIILAELIRKLSDHKELALLISKEFSQYLDPTHIESLKGQELKNNEDVLDSMICLYTAGLYALGVTECVYGSVEDGYIYIPKLNASKL